MELISFELHVNGLLKGKREFSLWTLYCELLPVYRNGNSSREYDRKLSDSRHDK
jgi:hypothetical protein